MTRHLSRDALLAVVEGGTVDALVSAHARECARCAAEIESLSRTLRDLRDVRLPEPSPLFWQHLSANIRAAVDAEPTAAIASDAYRRPGWRWWVSAGSLAAAVLALLVTTSLSPVSRPEPGAGLDTLLALAPDTDPGPTDPWEVVVEVASAADAAGVSEDSAAPPPGIGDSALLDLTPDEQAEMARLLRLELGGASL